MTQEALLRRRRMERGWTLRTLGDRCAEEGVTVTYSHLSKIERQLVLPNPKLRVALAKILDLDVIDDFHREAS